MSNSLLSNKAFNRVTVYNENENVNVEPLVIKYNVGPDDNYTISSNKISDEIYEYTFIAHDIDNEHCVHVNYNRTKYKDTVVTTGMWNIHSLSNTEDNVVVIVNRMTNVDIAQEAGAVPDITIYDILNGNGKFKNYKKMTRQKNSDQITLTLK